MRKSVKEKIMKKELVCNYGKHVLHFGGKYDSYLLVPKIPSGEI